MLSLATLVKTTKRYAIDSSVSNVEFLNALLEPYISAGRVRGRGGVDFHLDPQRTSKLLNGKADVPLTLKKPLPRFGIVQSTARNMGVFLDDYLDRDASSELTADILGLLDGGDSAEGKLRGKLEALTDDLEAFFATALVESLRATNLASTRKVVWQNGTGSFSVEVGDLLSKGFGRRRKYRNVVVVPVNSAFDTEVSWGQESTRAPVVSERSLHGAWLVRMYQSGQDSSSLQERVEASLAIQGIAPLDELRGRARYPVGTVAIIENDRASFYLLAISRFDDDNMAHSSPETIEEALNALIDTYDARGQGLDIYLPLMGTGLSRAGLSNGRSFELIMDVVSRRRADIHGNMSLVVRPSDASQLKGLSIPTTEGGHDA